MSTLDISLPEPLKAFVDEQVSRRGYGDASAYLCDLVESDRRRRLREELEQQLLTAARGPSHEVAGEWWDQLRREGIRQIQQRKAQ